ncbi:SGNH/GDSL hydrolase family protein [Limosilactobacillus sp. STM2_1]|uniref:SGNH/GDSL hydrolase family protein n=1 Tax=Limosilactobacillus rudii TaxID=2759755 RepID=A0A7W3UK71_9LACO|nr:SGNH/GDSL hydrolase family protein [Limosilactobacillus rudii]MBB1079099.1 SGNH/GDSL hydrolase family protein [Limosilactobacillus rudii]MBB1097026.1 SGNH/GDSL hydrolase family protein [Limosilactobacillus rudii]MCD7133994.1 SGNH/GDSL hydrolase family protein [Limosilactobacillus rudii]
MKKWKRLLLVVLVMVGVIGGGWYAYNSSITTMTRDTKSVAPKYIEKKNVRLVALGDSLTHGQGDEDNNGGYVGIIKSKIEHHYKQTKVTTINYGVTGDRSDQILDRVDQQSQLRKDLQAADVITMTVGGNDLMQILEKNVMGSENQVTSSVRKGEKTYQQKLVKLFNAVRQENPKAPIFVMSIYNPFYTYFPDVTIIDQSIGEWNQTTQNAMSNYHYMYFVDINKVMSYGQYQTKNQQQKLIKEEKQANQGKVSQKRVIEIMNHKDQNLNKYISTTDNFHPNHAGYSQIAARLFDSMEKHDSWEFTRR